MLCLQVKIMTEKECALGVSFYPDFAYNAEGGGGYGAFLELCRLWVGYWGCHIQSQLVAERSVALTTRRQAVLPARTVYPSSLAFPRR